MYDLCINNIEDIKNITYISSSYLINMINIYKNKYNICSKHKYILFKNTQIIKNYINNILNIITA